MRFGVPESGTSRSRVDRDRTKRKRDSAAALAGIARYISLAETLAYIFYKIEKKEKEDEEPKNSARAHDCANTRRPARVYTRHDVERVETIGSVPITVCTVTGGLH